MSTSPEATPQKPRLTAAVVVGEQRQRARRCLNCLLEQTAIAEMEIRILDVGPAPARIEGLEHPAVHYKHSPGAASYGRARAELAHRARGGVVAFIEDHCYPEPEWASAVLRAFERPRVQGVTYAIGNANPKSWVSRAFHLVEYGLWMPPVKPGPVRIAASANIAYRRGILQSFGGALADLLDAEFLLHRRLRRQGGEVWLEPGARAAHEFWVELAPGLRANTAIKRIIGAQRAETGGWGWGRRLVFAAGMALSPALHLGRLARSMAGRPALWGVFWANLPLAALIYVLGAWGEAMGYLSGFGSSREQLLAAEVTLRRDA